MTERVCEWCGGPIQANARRDAVTCKKACRQARHRFRVGAAPAARGKPLSFGYADPPYPKLARKYYAADPRCAEVDHRALVERMLAEFPDGWALSTSAAALVKVIKLCPDEARVAVWVKGSRAGVSWRARSAYEPVIIYRGRARRMERTEELDDVLLWGGRQHSHPGALVGMKPAAFAEWLFRQLGACRGDRLTDLFPGSGAIGRAWQLYVGGPVDMSPDASNDMSNMPEPIRSSLPSRMAEASHGAGARLAPQQRLQLEEP